MTNKDYIYYGNVFSPPLFYQYIMGFVCFIVILKIINTCLSTFIYSTETCVAFKSCDIYALYKNILFCDFIRDVDIFCVAMHIFHERTEYFYDFFSRGRHLTRCEVGIRRYLFQNCCFSILKMGLLSKGENLLPFTVDPFSEGSCESMKTWWQGC